MSTDYITLATHTLSDCNRYRKPKELPLVVHLDDPALDIFFDFRHLKPLVIHSEQHMTEARKKMEHRTLHLMLVTDESGTFVGIITLEDILGSKPLQLQQNYRVELADLLVKHIMVPKENLVSVDFEDLKLAKVGHIIKTLHDKDKRFLFVTEKLEIEGKPVQRLRGVFSDTQIGKQLGINIRDPYAKALSIAELQKLIDK